uniref:LIM zinc-binding domain-containing protein n=1 Tax=Cyanistes caeruleus TaxID=156563 RepID=A0A8C0ULP6_CYACU
MPSISSDRAALCAGCGGKISDRYYLLAVDKQWHMRCLKCCECKLNLENLPSLKCLLPPPNRRTTAVPVPSTTQRALSRFCPL